MKVISESRLSGISMQQPMGKEYVMVCGEPWKGLKQRQFSNDLMKTKFWHHFSSLQGVSPILNQRNSFSSLEKNVQKKLNCLKGYIKLWNQYQVLRGSTVFCLNQKECYWQRYFHKVRNHTHFLRRGSFETNSQSSRCKRICKMRVQLSLVALFTFG